GARGAPGPRRAGGAGAGGGGGRRRERRADPGAAGRAGEAPGPPRGPAAASFDGTGLDSRAPRRHPSFMRPSHHTYRFSYFGYAYRGTTPGAGARV
ncbi:MAG: hypothetical protein WEB88_15800, partial [Gemmatimonadota bacterium]